MKNDPEHVEKSEVTSIKTSKQKCNGNSINGSSHHSHHTPDRDLVYDDSNADDILELDTDDLIIQDECCDEEIRGMV